MESCLAGSLCIVTNCSFCTFPNLGFIKYKFWKGTRITERSGNSPFFHFGNSSVDFFKIILAMFFIRDENATVRLATFKGGIVMQIKYREHASTGKF